MRYKCGNVVLGYLISEFLNSIPEARPSSRDNNCTEPKWLFTNN